MATSFKSFSELLENVEATKKRLDITEQTANYLKTLNAQEVEPTVNMMVGRAFPKYSQKNLSVNWITLTHALERISGVNWKRIFREAMTKTADIGSATKMALEQTKAKKQTQLTLNLLTIGEVRRTFNEIAEAQGVGARIRKESLIITLLSNSSPLESKYLVKIFTGDMRTGLHEGLMEQAIARAFDVPLLKVQHAAMVLGDIGEVAEALKTHDITVIEEAGFSVFRPVKLMLAQTANSVANALAEHGGSTALEYKYDGARVQVHVQNGKVEIFSRRLSDVTKSLPDVAQTIRQNSSRIYYH